MKIGNKILKRSFLLHVRVHVHVVWTHHTSAGMLNIPIQGQGEAFLPLKHSCWCESLPSSHLSVKWKLSARLKTPADGSHSWSRLTGESEASCFQIPVGMHSMPETDELGTPARHHISPPQPPPKRRCTTGLFFKGCIPALLLYTFF